MKAFLNALATVSVIFFTILMACAVSSMIPQRWIKIKLHIPDPVETPVIDHASIDCMAQNIYWEARGESFQGKMMVAKVVIERTRSPHFPESICDVIFQANRDAHGNIIKYQCSFSWVCTGGSRDINYYSKAWKESLIVAKIAMKNRYKDDAKMNNVTHYHNDTVHPYWAKNKNYKLVAKVGHHMFYRWKNADCDVGNTLASN